MDVYTHAYLYAHRILLSSDSFHTPLALTTPTPNAPVLISPHCNHFGLKTLVKVNRSLVLLESIFQLCRRSRSPLREVGDRRRQEHAQGETDERELGEGGGEFTTGAGECTLVREEGHNHWGDDKYGTVLPSARVEEKEEDG